MLLTAETATAILALSASVAAAPAPKYPCLAKARVCPGGFDKRAEATATSIPTNVDEPAEGRGFGRIFGKRDAQNVGYIWDGHSTQTITISVPAATPTKKISFGTFDKKDETNVEEVGWNRFDKEVAEATATSTPTNTEQPEEAEIQIEAAAEPTKTALQILKGPWKWDKRNTEEERAELHLILPKEKKSEMNVAYLDPHDINLNPKRSDAHLGLPKQEGDMNVAFLDPNDVNLHPKRSDAHLGLPKQEGDMNVAFLDPNDVNLHPKRTEAHLGPPKN
ncbi:hypothetical protein B0J14DRAFT_555516 [Halenospora varia]|nr:hypothetical protein B0J14DRAFT_555516 [Halenospora varia]